MFTEHPFSQKIPPKCFFPSSDHLFQHLWSQSPLEYVLKQTLWRYSALPSSYEVQEHGFSCDGAHSGYRELEQIYTSTDLFCSAQEQICGLSRKFKKAKGFTKFKREQNTNFRGGKEFPLPCFRYSVIS